MASPPATLNKANKCFFAVSLRIPIPTANPRKIIPRISSARTALSDSGIGRKPNTSERRDSFMSVLLFKHPYKIQIIYCIRNTGDPILKSVSKVLHFVNLAHFLSFCKKSFQFFRIHK